MLQIFDLTGKEVFKCNVKNEMELNTGLPSGLYVLKLEEQGTTSVKRLIVK